jgi:hypothetical protein
MRTPVGGGGSRHTVVVGAAGSCSRPVALGSITTARRHGRRR